MTKDRNLKVFGFYSRLLHNFRLITNSRVIAHKNCADHFDIASTCIHLYRTEFLCVKTFNLNVCQIFFKH